MVGEKATSRPLRLVWQGNQGRADGAQPSSRCRIALVGVGAAVSSAITQLAKLGASRARTIAVDIDPLKLRKLEVDSKILIPKEGTQELLSACFPPREVAAEARMHALRQLDEALADVDIVFIVARLDSGIAARATPVIAEIARRKGALTLSVVTRPLRPENKENKRISHTLNELRKKCDTVAVVDNAELIGLAHQFSLNEEELTNRALANIVKGIVNTFSEPSLTKTDFAEFRNIIKHGGLAAVGMGESSAPNRAKNAVLRAFENPLLDADNSSATSLLAYIIGDSHMTIEEANNIGEIISGTVGSKTRVICSANMDSELAGTIRVILVMTGIDAKNMPQAYHRIAPHLYNLEPHAEPETKLPINLGLYQLETFES
jgi:cell division protein FtsZ